METKIEISIEPAIAGGKYSNLALVNHSESEFILDFAQNMPGMPTAQVVSRIILTPDHAKRVLNALADNIQKYESKYGEIKVAKGTYNLTGGTAQA